MGRFDGRGYALVRIQTQERRTIRFHARLEELESRLAPASYAINAQLQITFFGEPGALATGVAGTSPAAHSVVFFESSVADYRVLRQGLSADTDSVVLDSAGDGLKEIAAFLGNRHDLTSIGVVAHGSPGAVALGTMTLDLQSLGTYTRELAVLGSALGRGGEVDLWSCDVAAGLDGHSLVRDLAIATCKGVAAADYSVGSSVLGGSWQLDVRAAGARGEVPFSASSLGDFNQVLGVWSTAASMSTPRFGATATLLGNGKVLVAGGQGANFVAQSSAELYDPATNAWSPAGSMATPRAFQTATLLDNGEVLIAGGEGNIGDPPHNGPPLASAELYNPATNTWSSAGNMSSARSGHTATRLSNGMVLVAGGQGPSINSALVSSAELYDPIQNSWSDTASMASVRDFAAATLLTNGTVLVAGGGYTNGIANASAELYDPVHDTWSFAGPMGAPRDNHVAALLGNGEVLIAGGVNTGGSNNTVASSAELYDPASNTWSGAASMATGRAQSGSTLLTNGELLVTGGLTVTSYHYPAPRYMTRFIIPGLPRALWPTHGFFKRRRYFPMAWSWRQGERTKTTLCPLQSCTIPTPSIFLSPPLR